MQIALGLFQNENLQTLALDCLPAAELAVWLCEVYSLKCKEWGQPLDFSSEWIGISDKKPLKK